MASKSDPVNVLISIHPRHASKILSGVKRAEFRRRSPKRNAAFAIVYATSPIKRVVGFAKIAGVVEGSLEALWSQYGSVGGITKAEFDEYFAGASGGSVILLDEAKRLKEPWETNRVTEGGVAPQSFKYVSVDTISQLAAGC